MELQQRTELNIGASRSPRQPQQADAGASQRADQRSADSRADSSFNEQVKKQLEREKTQQARENSSNNQKDRKSSVESEQASTGTSQRPADASRAESNAVEEDTTASEHAEAGQATTDFAGQLQSGLLDAEAATEAAAETGALASSELPQGGNELPSQAVALNVMSANMTSSETGSADAADGDKLNARMLQQKASAADQAVLQSLNQQASRINREGAAEMPAVDTKGLKLNLSDDLTTARNAQFKALSELPAAEMIGKASRLQQVPLSTALASSMPASANVNAAPLSALDSAGFNLNAPLTGSLSAAGLSTSIMTPLHSSGWSQQMTDQVNLMLKGGFQQADIKLNPAHLGPMEIKLSMKDDKASIHFVAQHAPVRDAIDSALPRLREMLEQQGLSLADVDVSSHSEQQQSDAEAQQPGSGMMQQAGMADNSQQGADELPMTQVSLSIESGVNLYA